MSRRPLPGNALHLGAAIHRLVLEGTAPEAIAEQVAAASDYVSVSQDAQRLLDLAAARFSRVQRALSGSFAMSGKVAEAKELLAEVETLVVQLRGAL